MLHKFENLDHLVKLSRNLGKPELDYVILGDGNTSAKIDDRTFWVKASGAHLSTIDADEFVEVTLEKVLKILEVDTLTDEEIAFHLTDSMVDPTVTKRASIETLLHAIIYSLCEARYIGHTHPVALNSILCSKQAEDALSGNIFTEQILYCGPAPAFVPYADPGIPLAHSVLEVIRNYQANYGESPRVIMLQNHGLVVMGKTPKEVENITAMSVKAARILLGTYLLGGPRFLSRQDVQRIYTRPDEAYRREKSNNGKD